VTTVLLVDDQELVRAGFRIILNSEPGIDVVGEAASGADAITAARALHPDVICMDVQMPGMDGLEATRQLVADPSIDAGILILTTFNRDDYLFEALQAGASGFLLKTASPEQLVEAVAVVARGDALLSPDVTRSVIQRSVGRSDDSASTGDAEPEASARPVPDPGLTEREAEVLTLIARGLSNGEIATLLFLGEATVKTHVSKVLQKLSVRDRVQAVVFAYQHGLVAPGP
jgi:DNA-binding NarL/FixJ family response regulator